MKRFPLQFCAGLGIASAYLLAGNPMVAQIVPDATLSVNSIVTPIGNTLTIEGGTQAGGNLFHSFGEFSVPTGGIAYFNNAVNIQNIFSRVTGSSVSNINGTILTNGTVNLFLLNPNGIIFGPNALLNIAGSFVATTARSLNFADGTQFATMPSQTTPLLTVSVPVGLQFASNASTIQVQGTMLVGNGTLALVGGNTIADGGKLIAPGGRIELGGLAEAGTVGLNADRSLTYPTGVARSDVLLTNGSRLDVRGANGGSIAINARNLDILGLSRLNAGIRESSGSANSQAGDITLNATGAITLARSYIFNNVETQAKGQGGNISITANSLSLTDVAQIGAITFGEGNAGRVSLQINDSVFLAGNGTAIFGTVEPQATGNSGGISIKAGSLAMRDDAILITTTYGKGNAGNISIEVDDFMSLLGGESVRVGLLPLIDAANIAIGNSNAATTALNRTQAFTDPPPPDGTPAPGPAPGPVPPPPPDAPAPPPLTTVLGSPAPIGFAISTIFPTTSIFSTVEAGGVGNAGDISIQARSLSLTSGAEILTLTRGLGNAGTLRVNVTDSVRLSGVSSDGYSTGLFTSTERPNSQQGGDLIVNTGELRLSDGAVLSARTTSAFRGGDITVNVNTLELTGGAQILATAFGAGGAGNINVNAAQSVIISGSDRTYASRLAQFGRDLVDPDGPESGFSVSGRDTGGAGNLEIRASSILLNDRGRLSAETVAGDRGNITLQTQNLQLRGNSAIAANATGTATGGNININADVIAALENSDISANSVASRGGRVTLNVTGIFGAQFRDKPNDATSDITATGADSSLSGTVIVNTPEIDPSSGLVELSKNPIDATKLVASVCTPSIIEGSSFIVTGRGGIPPSPTETLADEAVWMDIRPSVAQAHRSRGVQQKLPNATPEIVEATGWITTPDGKVVLTALAPNPTPPSLTNPSCQASQ